MGHRPSPILSTCLGKTPAALRPYLGGARGTALEKTSKAGAADVRPSCAGEAVRRLVGKALLRSDLTALRAHLLPHQLAVGLPPEPKLCHIFTEWRQYYLAGTDLVCLSYDEGNAHNAVDRHVFLTRMQEVAPGLSRWLEYIYPTDLDTKVFYHKVIIRSAAGGQQGCPLRTACHAVVQRLLLESLGLIDPPAGSGGTAPGPVGHGPLFCRCWFTCGPFGGGLACSSALVACPATPWSSSFSVLCCSGCWHFAPG